MALVGKRVTETITYGSLTRPEIVTSNPNFLDAIDWADANPLVWELTGPRSRSKTFGPQSSYYLGAHRGPSVAAWLGRVETCRRDRATPDTIWAWRLAHALAHYRARDLRSGFFQQWDGAYDRHSLQLDYTPASRNAAIARFLAWCDAGGPRFETRGVKIDGHFVTDCPSLPALVPAKDPPTP